MNTQTHTITHTMRHSLHTLLLLCLGLRGARCEVAHACVRQTGVCVCVWESFLAYYMCVPVPLCLSRFSLFLALSVTVHVFLYLWLWIAYNTWRHGELRASPGSPVLSEPPSLLVFVTLTQPIGAGNWVFISSLLVSVRFLWLRLAAQTAYKCVVYILVYRYMLAAKS